MPPPSEPSAWKRTTTRRLDRPIDNHDDHLGFTVDALVPFDNNAAEREVRMVKVGNKVSGRLRTLGGAEQFTTNRSYLATDAKYGIGLFCDSPNS